MAELIPALREVIAEEAAAMIAFVSLLEGEKRLLLDANVAGLEDLNAKKTPLVAQLTRIGNQRDAILRDLGVEPTRDGVNTFLSEQAADLQPAWVTLIELAHTANQLNSANSALVNARLQQNQQALSILMSADGQAVNSSTYGPDGHKIQGAQTRPLGSA